MARLSRPLASPLQAGDATTGVWAARARAVLPASWPQAVLWLGIAALVLPTLYSLARQSWSSESGAHGPIVLATALWLLWHERAAFAARRVQPLFPAVLVLIVALIGYFLARVTSILAGETLSLYLALLTLVYLAVGGKVMLRLWFPLAYLLFLVTPPENYMVVGTQPIKIFLSESAVDLLSWFGYAVGRTGVIIQIDGYQLLVATACSGVNSLVGICAISSFYVYLRHGSQPRYALILAALLLPIAIFANLLRILALVLMTHYFGEATAQGVMHELTGMGIFIVSLILLIAIDALLSPLLNRQAEALR